MGSKLTDHQKQKLFKNINIINETGDDIDDTSNDSLTNSVSAMSANSIKGNKSPLRGNENVEQPKEKGQDSDEIDEIKANVGKKIDEVKLKKLMKEKLKATNVPRLMLVHEDNLEKVRFENLFEFKGFLGTGSFGFVVHAIDLATGQDIAIKVSISYISELTFGCR